MNSNTTPTPQPPQRRDRLGPAEPDNTVNSAYKYVPLPPPTTDELHSTHNGHSNGVSVSTDGDSGKMKPWQPTVQTAKQLMEKDIPPPRWVVKDLIAEGVGLLAGKAKKGKTVLATNLALAVVYGQPALGVYETIPTDVLYLALEDTERRMKRRLAKMLGTASAPSGLHLVYEWLMLDEGGLQALDRWLDQHPSVGLVIVDTLTRIRRKRHNSESGYLDDYNALKDLHTLAKQRHLGVLPIVHTRKLAADDPLDELNATMGLGASADNILLLRQVGGVTQLDRVGRDYEDDTPIALHRDADLLRWVYDGNADDVRQSQQRKAILDMLDISPMPLGPRDIAAATGAKEGAVRFLLSRLLTEGKVAHLARGQYGVPGRVHAAPPPAAATATATATPANNANKLTNAAQTQAPSGFVAPHNVSGGGSGNTNNANKPRAKRGTARRTRATNPGSKGTRARQAAPAQPFVSATTAPLTNALTNNAATNPGAKRVGARKARNVSVVSGVSGAAGAGTQPRRWTDFDDA